MGSDSEWDQEGSPGEFDDDGLSEFLKEFERAPEGPPATEEGWVKALIDGLGPVGPWAEASKALEKYAMRCPAGKKFADNLCAQLESIRLSTTIGQKFTSKDLRQKGASTGDWLFRVLVRKGALRLTAKRIRGAGGRGLSRIVYQRMA